jgi:hypothetical protein
MLLARKSMGEVTRRTVELVSHNPLSLRLQLISSAVAVKLSVSPAMARCRETARREAPLSGPLDVGDGVRRLACLLRCLDSGGAGWQDSGVGGGELTLAGGQAAERDVVFVSYSHTDRVWLDRLLVLLTPLVRNRRLVLWADPYTQSARTDGATSPRSLTERRWCAAGERGLPRVAVHHGGGVAGLVRHGVTLAPVLVRDCLWKQEPLLEQVQWAHDPGRDGPLARSAKSMRDGRLVRICERLMDLVLTEPGAAVDAVQAPPAKTRGRWRSR